MPLPPVTAYLAERRHRWQAEKEALRNELQGKEKIIVKLERKIAGITTSADVTREGEMKVGAVRPSRLP